MALESYALSTLDEVKDYLDVTNDVYDVRLEQLINEYSRYIVTYTGNEYAPVTSSSTRVVEYRVGSVYIDLFPYNARSVTAVTIDPDAGTPLVLETGEWQLRPITSPDGVYDRVALKTGVTYASSSFDRVPVEITGTWGWSEVPEDVKGWLREIIEDRFREDIGAFADASGNVLDTQNGVTAPVSIPFRIQRELERARRHYIGRS